MSLVSTNQATNMPITTRSVHREEQLRLDELKIEVPCDVWFEIAKQLDDFVQSYQMLCISSEAQIGIGDYLRQLRCQVRVRVCCTRIDHKARRRTTMRVPNLDGHLQV